VLVIPRAVRVYFATAPVNLRKSFEGLSNEVRAVLAKDPLAGHVFVFLGVARSKGFWGRTRAERVGPGGGLRRSTQAEEAEKEPQMSGISSAGQIAA